MTFIFSLIPFPLFYIVIVGGLLVWPMISLHFIKNEKKRVITAPLVYLMIYFEIVLLYFAYISLYI